MAILFIVPAVTLFLKKQEVEVINNHTLINQGCALQNGKYLKFLNENNLQDNFYANWVSVFFKPQFDT